ncbi:FeoA family protein [Scatolibacter rhodanostii]|uniref:FeoA family protein n=1 Tax=Scatolibacter rhodanostii TaxID=2014781 RepID=UPI00278BE3AB|nr:FeoA family protein [Scatolibacter rhodanostii]
MAFFREMFSKSSDARERVEDQKQSADALAGFTAQSAGQTGFPLGMAKTGEMQHVTLIKGKDEIRRFLGSLGFAEGAEVMLISEMNGNVIVNVKGTRVAISKAMAMRVYVA